MQRRAAETKSHELVEYQLRLEIAEDKVDSLQKSLSTAEDKIVVLRDNLSFVMQERANLEGQIKQLLTAVNEKMDS